MNLFLLIINAICGALFSWGGHSFIQARRFIMPVAIGITVSIVTTVWWSGLLVLPVMGTLCLGYPKFIKNQFLARGGWLALQAFTAGGGLVYFHFLAWYWYALYVIVAFLLGGFLYNVTQIIGDFIFGIWMSVIVWVVKK